VVYLLGALLDGVKKMHGQPEAVCRKVVQKRDLGISHVNLCGCKLPTLVTGAWEAITVGNQLFFP
jgi:hypothetical protein